jgi:hypothetical protein
VRIELIQLAIDDHGCIKHRVTTMHHVIIERQDHKRRVGDYASQDAGVHSVEINGLGMHSVSQARAGFIRGKNGSRPDCWHR